MATIEQIDRLMRAGKSDEEICAELNIASPEALAKRLQRAHKAIEVLEQRRCLIDRDAAKPGEEADSEASE